MYRGFVLYEKGFYFHRGRSINLLKDEKKMTIHIRKPTSRIVSGVHQIPRTYSISTTDMLLPFFKKFTISLFTVNSCKPRNLGHYNNFSKYLVGNLGTSQYITSCHFTEYVPSSIAVNLADTTSRYFQKTS